MIYYVESIMTTIKYLAFACAISIASASAVAGGLVTPAKSPPAVSSSKSPSLPTKTLKLADVEFEKGNVAFNANEFSKAHQLWLPLAEKGHPQAQYAVGRLYEKGKGVERDFATAAKWYRLAAEKDHADSQYRLAVGYAYGLGLKKDDSLALTWLRKAANNGHKRAQKILGRAYEEGRLGLAADPDKAKYWYDKAKSGS